SRLGLLALALTLVALRPADAQPPAKKPDAKSLFWWRPQPAPRTEAPGRGLWGLFGRPAPKRADDKLPLCGLPPAKLIPNLCLLKYRIGTGSPECQAFFDQGLGYFYSYVWMEAARSFETAARHDPNCP